MGSLMNALIIVLCINALMMITQTAVLDINPANIFYNGTGGIIETYNIDTADPKSELPGGSGDQVEGDTGFFSVVTDLFSSFTSWLLDTTGLSSVISILKAPYNYLKAFGLPIEFVNIIGTLWYIITFVLLVLVLLQRDQ